MVCGDQGRLANATNLLSQAGRFLLRNDEAKSIMDVMKDRVKVTWYDVARRVGVSERDCERIQSAFVYQGFDLEKVAPVGRN